MTDKQKYNMADNYNAVSEIAAKHLGQVGGAGYKDSYDPELLVKIPRVLNREAYGIEEDNLPFVGGDVWNAYEVSALTSKGLPVSGMLKIWCPADSQYHVESKSIKLYLNSFNMTVMGDNSAEAVKEIEERVERDLSELLETEVRVKLFTSEFELSVKLHGFMDLANLVDLDSLEFNSYRSDASQLEVQERSDTPGQYKFRSNLLRSNCRVTNQPDWGDIFIHIKTDLVPDPGSLAKYIVSHRKVNHFHEEICEMTFTHLMEAYNPEELMVACLYTRRGGIDINPVRATDPHLIPDVFTDIDIRLDKTLRQ